MRTLPDLLKFFGRKLLDRTPSFNGDAPAFVIAASMKVDASGLGEIDKGACKVPAEKSKPPSTLDGFAR